HRSSVRGIRRGVRDRRELASGPDRRTRRRSDAGRRARTQAAGRGAPERQHGRAGPEGLMPPAPSGTLELTDGRRLAYDDVGAVAADMLPFVAPEGLDPALALEHIREAKSDAYLRDLDSVPTLAGQLALALQAAIANGSSGAEFDLRNLMTQWDIDLGAIEV